MCLLGVSEFGFFQEIAFAGQCFDGVFVMRQVQVCCPCEVTALNIGRTDGQVDADILCLSDIPHHIGESRRTGNSRV